MLKNTVSSRQVLLIWLGVLSLCRWAAALETVSLGENGSLNWRGEGSSAVEIIEPQYRSLFQNDDVPGVELEVGNSPGNLIEFESDEFPGSIHPLRIPDGENIANTALKRGGGITAPNVFDLGGFAAGIFDANDLRLTLEELIETKDGGEIKAFERKNYNALGTLIFVDLGGLFGVNRVRFYPRNTVFPSPTTPFHNDFLRAFELFTNDGSQTEGGNLIWEPLLLEPDNRALSEPCACGRLLRSTTRSTSLRCLVRAFCPTPSIFRPSSMRANLRCGTYSAGRKKQLAILPFPISRFAPAQVGILTHLSLLVCSTASAIPQKFRSR